MKNIFFCKNHRASRHLWTKIYVQYNYMGALNSFSYYSISRHWLMAAAELFALVSYILSIILFKDIFGKIHYFFENPCKSSEELIGIYYVKSAVT